MQGAEDPTGPWVRRAAAVQLDQQSHPAVRLLVGHHALDDLRIGDVAAQEEKVFLNVRPGITGYNQAYYRNSADAQEKIDNDVYYAKNISFALDVKIILKTIKTVLYRENVNVTRE